MAVASWVDPVTNLAVLTTIDLQEHMDLVLTRRLPGQCWASFIHELTHHWCFHSSVGNTLAALALRARRRGLMAANDDEAYEVIDDTIRFETAQAMLRPFSEGLALFAEFDLRPAKSKVRSMPMLWTWLMFAGHASTQADTEGLDPAIETDLQTFTVIYRARLGEALRSRKENLLVLPLKCAGTDGYLHGYLAVKGLWWHLCARDPLFRDADYFFTFLRNFIYEDLGLVHALLDPHTSDLGAGDAIISHIAERFNQLVESDLADIPRQFETFLSGLKPGSGKFPERITMPPVLTDPAIATAGLERYDELYSSIRAEANGDSPRNVLARMDAWTLAQRECMCLGSTPVELQIGESGYVGVFLDGLPVRGGKGVTGVAPGKMNGNLHVYFSPSNGYIVLVASVEGRAVLVYFLGEADEHIRTQFQGYMVDRDLAVDLMKEGRETFESTLAQSRHQYIVTVWREQLLSGVEELNSQLALLQAASDRWPAIRAEMARDGFYDVLGRSSAAVRGLAYLGLLQSVGAMDEARALLEADGLSYDETIQRLEDADRRTGLPLLHRTEDAALVLV